MVTINDYMPYCFDEISKLSFYYGYTSIKEKFEIFIKYVEALLQLEKEKT